MACLHQSWLLRGAGVSRPESFVGGPGSYPRNNTYPSSKADLRNLKKKEKTLLR